MADIKINPHSFAAVISRLELNGYLTPYPENESSDELPLPTMPVDSYKRTASMSSTSQDSFYTLYDDLPSDLDSGTATPRVLEAKKGSRSPHVIEIAVDDATVDEFTIIEPPEDRPMAPNGVRSHVEEHPPGRILLEPTLEEGRSSVHEIVEPAPLMSSFDDVITEEELQMLEDEITPRIKPRSKNLAKIFGQDPKHTYTPGKNEESMQDSHLGDLRKRLAWRSTAASTEEKEADKRDFAKMVVGEDGGLADKLFGRGLESDNNDSLDTRRKLAWKFVAGSEKEKAADERDIADLMRSESEAQRVDKVFGAKVRAHAKLRKASLGPPTIPPRASSAIHATSVLPADSADSTPRASDLTITDTLTSKPYAAQSNHSSVPEDWESSPRSRPSTATPSFAPPSTVDSGNTSDFRSFSDMYAPSSTSGQVKRLTAYHDPPPTDSEVSSITTDSSATASDGSDEGSEIESSSLAPPESPLSDAASDAGTATDTMSYKTSMSMSSLSESIISTRDLSVRPAHISTSNPSLRRAFDRSRLPLQSHSTRSPSLDSAAPPPISLVRPETPPRTPRRRPLGTLFRKSAPTSPTGSMHRGGRSPPPPVPKIDPAAAAAARAAAERELLYHSVAYEAAAVRPTPFTSRHTANVFPRRKHRRERVHLGREMLQEHELLEAMELSSRRMEAEREERERLAADVVHELMFPPSREPQHAGFYEPVGPVRRGVAGDPFVEQGRWAEDDNRASRRLSALVEEDGD